MIRKDVGKVSMGKMVGGIVFRSGGVWWIEKWCSVRGWVGGLLKRM